MEVFPKKIMLLGSGELGKEIAICAKRLGCIVIACDRYSNAPAMQVVDAAEVLDMRDRKSLQSVIDKHKPDVIIPEIEALATDVLIDCEKKGFLVIPNARATSITMNRDQIRELAANQLGLRTAKFKYASTYTELEEASEIIGFPNVIKPLMSSSGKGQSLVEKFEDLEKAWNKALKDARGNSDKVIIEEYINFKQEITLLTIKQKKGDTIFCAPIAHQQVNGDYQYSWQPASIKNDDLEKAKNMAKLITDNLGGIGLFGVEFFITDREVIFSELSPRPHDTGLVTMVSQSLSEFELHIRAVLGLPIPNNIQARASASQVILANKKISNATYTGIEKALKDSEVSLLIFGKKSAKAGRRMGVTLATGKSIEDALEKAQRASKFIKVLDESYN